VALFDIAKTIGLLAKTKNKMIIKPINFFIKA
jgi:hypothetical protein